MASSSVQVIPSKSSFSWKAPPSVTLSRVMGFVGVVIGIVIFALSFNFYPRLQTTSPTVTPVELMTLRPTTDAKNLQKLACPVCSIRGSMWLFILLLVLGILLFLISIVHLVNEYRKPTSSAVLVTNPFGSSSGAVSGNVNVI